MKYTIFKGIVTNGHDVEIDIRTPLDKIMYLKKQDEHIHAYLNDGSRLTRRWTNLKPFLAELDNVDILQIHESTAINTQYLFGYNAENCCCYLSATGRNEHLIRLPISEGRLGEFKGRFLGIEK